MDVDLFAAAPNDDPYVCLAVDRLDSDDDPIGGDTDGQQGITEVRADLVRVDGEHGSKSGPPRSQSPRGPAPTAQQHREEWPGALQRGQKWISGADRPGAESR